MVNCEHVFRRFVSYSLSGEVWRSARHVEAVERAVRDTCSEVWDACNRDWEISAFLETI